TAALSTTCAPVAIPQRLRPPPQSLSLRSLIWPESMKILSFIVTFSAICLLSSCRYQTNHIKASSPLHSILTPQFDQTTRSKLEAEAKQYLLRELPVGSTEAEISQFISGAFDGGRRTRYEVPVPNRYRKSHYICIRSGEWGSFGGSSWEEIVFILDTNRKMKDVI